MGFVDAEDFAPIKDPSKIALLVARMCEKQPPYAVMDIQQDGHLKPSSDSPPSPVVPPSAALAPASSGPTESPGPVPSSTTDPVSPPSGTTSSASLLDDEASRHVRLVAHKPAKAIDGAATLVALDFAGQVRPCVIRTSENFACARPYLRTFCVHHGLCHAAYVPCASPRLHL
jgi:hypothetical protein